MLWQVKDTNKYFLCSMHILPEADAALDRQIWDLVRRRPRIVFESDLSKGRFPAEATYQDGNRLQEFVPSDIYAKCARLWAELELKDELSVCKPWWAAMQIGLAVAAQNGFLLNHGVEQQLLKQLSLIQPVYLEDPRAAILPFIESPLSEQAIMLAQCSKGEASIMKEFRFVHESWRHSDLSALSKYLDEKRAEAPKTYTALIDERNEAWAPLINKFLHDSEPTLFVLGILHFVGKNKIPDCLNNLNRVVLQQVC